jgi:endonuclease/exonuclease/phosphatase family metal-dependent hydrolase
MTDNNKSGRKRLGLFNSLILVFNILFVSALLLSYLSVHISPQQSWLLPFFGLVYPFLILINLFLVIYWLIRKRWLFLLSALGIAIGWNHAERTVQIRQKVEKPSDVQAFNVITYNVKNLSNDNVDLLEPEVRNNIIDYIDAREPDIICLQEFSIVHPNPDAFLDSLSSRLGMPYHAYSLYLEKVRKRINAIYIFSKFPIINFNAIRKDELHNFALFADMIIGADTVRVYNIHLESLRLRQEDYKFISDLDRQAEDKESVKEGSSRILKKMKTAYSKRAFQVDSLMSSLQKSPYPVILCGDFNDTPNSYAYQQISANLTDSFLESGQGFGNTYSGKLPSYRIDYIMYSNYFTSWESKRERVNYSDHYPVSCWIGKRIKM